MEDYICRFIVDCNGVSVYYGSRYTESLELHFGAFVNRVDYTDFTLAEID